MDLICPTCVKHNDFHRVLVFSINTQNNNTTTIAHFVNECLKYYTAVDTEPTPGYQILVQNYTAV